MTKQYRLPRIFGTQWLYSLRSGNYKQGKESLFIQQGYNATTDAYCCLGVAARVCGIDTHSLQGQGYVYASGTAAAKVGDDNSKSEVLTALALNKNYPKELLYDDVPDSLACVLAEMNDAGDSFALIADWVEENVEFYD